jgi:Mn-containing catalase
MEPRHFLSAGLAALPSDANGVPFNAGYIDAAGNLIANMYANAAAEAVGRTLATRLLELTDDPGMQDMLRFLIARDTMHQQQWLAVIEELKDQGVNALNAPGDFENEGKYADYAYAFFNHNADGALTGDERFTSGPSLDGIGTFTLVDPAPALGKEPVLQPAPPQAHAGVEATGDVSTGILQRLGSSMKDAITG